MKTIRLAYADMWPDYNPESFELIKLLNKKYNIVSDCEKPDFVLCGPFGHDFLKYDCPRILYLGEAIAPDFNLYDYAIGFDKITFGDRYLRVPIYFFDSKSLKLAKIKHTYSDEFYLEKRKFCNFIVSNGSGICEREEVFKKLSSRKKVDSAGRYLNNMPDGKSCSNKLEFQRDYKFSLAFENSIMDGYITEKIVDAWAAGTVPIYYGGNGIDEEFNPNAFIDITKFSSIDECIDYILFLDKNPDEYIKLARAPIYAEGKSEKFEEEILNFFEKIFDDSKAGLKRYKRNSKLTMWGGNYEKRINESYLSTKERIKRRILSK